MDADTSIRNPHTLTSEQRKSLSQKKLLLEVSPFEAAIIKQIRKIPHGQITVHMIESIPIRYTIGANYLVNPTEDMEALLSGE